MKSKGKKSRPDAKAGRAGEGSPALRIPQIVEEEVDLHGLAVDEALVQVELALERYRRGPGAWIRIIHGHSSGDRNSIRGAVRRNLETLWRSRIRSFRPEPGNPGATLVSLGQS